MWKKTPNFRMEPKPNGMESVSLTIFRKKTIPARDKEFLQGKIKNDEESRVRKYESMVTPPESFQEPSRLWVTQTLGERRRSTLLGPAAEYS